MRLIAAAALVLVTAVPAAAFEEAAWPSRAPTSVEVARAIDGRDFGAAVIFDVANGQVLWGRRANQQRPVASLMKIGTALVASGKLYPTDELRMSERAARTPFDTVGWRAGARFTVDEVMHGALMMSSNGAARALAERTSGTIAAFRKLAARRLPELGATRTRLIDPSGLEAEGQYSTAGDIAVLSAALLEDPWLAQIVATTDYRLDWPGQQAKATFGNKNPYLRRDPTAVGVKHGFTSAAGNTLSAASTRGGRTHVVVVLDADAAPDLAKDLMDLAFEVAPGREDDLAAEAEAPEVADEVAPEVEPSVLGVTITRDAPFVPAPVTAAAPAGPEELGTGMRMMLAAPVLFYGARVWNLQRRRARRRRRLG